MSVIPTRGFKHGDFIVLSGQFNNTAFGTTRYNMPSTSLEAASSSGISWSCPLSGIIRLIRTSVNANDVNGDSTLTFETNATANDPTITIPASSGAGVFTTGSLSIAITLNETGRWSLVTGGSSGNITLGCYIYIQRVPD